MACCAWAIFVLGIFMPWWVTAGLSAAECSLWTDRQQQSVVAACMAIACPYEGTCHNNGGWHYRLVLPIKASSHQSTLRRQCESPQPPQLLTPSSARPPRRFWVVNMLLPCCFGRSMNVRRAAVAASMALCVYLVLAIILLPTMLVPRYRWVRPARQG